MPRLNNRIELKHPRRVLRASLTPAEARLWSALRNSNLAGRKFRRQHSVGRYILDFYCPAERIAIELDGAAHDSDRADAHDQMRDAWLAALRIRVLRIENRFVMADLEAVLQHIRSFFAA